MYLPIPIVEYSWTVCFNVASLANPQSMMMLLTGHVNNIPKMQFFSGISRNTQSKSYMLPLTECVWDFQNNELWDTH